MMKGKGKPGGKDKMGMASYKKGGMVGGFKPCPECSSPGKCRAAGKCLAKAKK